jgi:hypothetical protein
MSKILDDYIVDTRFESRTIFGYGISPNFMRDETNHSENGVDTNSNFPAGAGRLIDTPSGILCPNVVPRKIGAS